MFMACHRCSPPGWRMPALHFAGSPLLASTSSAQRSSPKTVEGAIGGVVVNVAVMLLCGLLFLLSSIIEGTAHVDYWVLFLMKQEEACSGRCCPSWGPLELFHHQAQLPLSSDFGQVILSHGGPL